MAHERYDNRNGPKSKDMPTSIANRKTVIRLPTGHTFLKSQTQRVIDPDTGEVTENVFENPEPNAVCIAPWGDHPPQPGYLGIDMFQAESGIALCTICMQKNQDKIKWSRRLGPFYNPETY